MILSIRDYTIIRYDASTGIQCSWMSLISVSWTLFKSSGLLHKLNFDCILGKKNQLFKFIGKLRYFGMDEFFDRKLFCECGIFRK